MSVNITADFCFENLSTEIKITSWYIIQIVMLFTYFGIFVLMLVAVELNYLNAKRLGVYQEFTQLSALAFVLVALANNLHKYLQSDSLPLCGLEMYPFCTSLTDEITTWWVHGYAVINFMFALLATGVAEFGKRRVIAAIDFRPVPLGCNMVCIRAYGRKFLTIAVEKVAILVTACFSPGMVLLEIMPYNDNCIQDENLRVVLAHTIAHASLFLTIIVGIGVDIYNKSQGAATIATIAAYLIGGIAMFFIQMFASASQPVMWSLWSFSVAFPSLVALSEKLGDVADTMMVAVFAMHSGSAFAKNPPGWSLAEQVQFYHQQRQRHGRPPLQLEEALKAMGDLLDRWYGKLEIDAILEAVRNEETNQNLQLPSVVADGLDLRECRLAIIALTTILPKRSRWYHRIVRRGQLFDRLHDVLEVAQNKDLEKWLVDYEDKLVPFLSLLAGGLATLPESAPQANGWIQNPNPQAFFFVRRMRQSDLSIAWFEDHLGASQAKDTVRGELTRPAIFRSFVWGHSDAASFIARAGVNDAVVCAQLLPAGMTVQANPVANFGVTRYIGGVASSSWTAANRGDILFCPAASFAVQSFTVDSDPMYIQLVDGQPYRP